jgi:hypothetical protein
MKRIVADQAFLSKLGVVGDPSAPAEVVNEDGFVVGVFTPTPWVVAGHEPPPLSREEVARRLASPGRPLADILADLEKRG